MENSTCANETLFFVNPPPLDQLCSVTLTIPTPEKPGGTPHGQQPQIIRCRELIFTEPHIIATPSLNFDNKVLVIMQQSVYRSGRLQTRFQKMGCQSEKPKRVTAVDYQSCLSYTLFARIAPAWNKAGEYLIQGRDFITNEQKINAVRFDLRVTEDEMYFTIVPAVLKCPPAKLRDLGICTPIVREFYALKPEAKIREYSIENKWCHILPSMKKGQIINVHHTIPADSPFKSYKDMKKHWKNTYGYRLPDADSGLLYYQVYFKLVGEMLFTYPDVCIRPRAALVFPRTDPRPILNAFLADLGSRLPTVCGHPLRIELSPAYMTPVLLPSEQVGEVSIEGGSRRPNLTASAPATHGGYKPSVNMQRLPGPPVSAASRQEGSLSQLPQIPASHFSTITTQRDSPQNPNGNQYKHLTPGGRAEMSDRDSFTVTAPAGVTRIVPRFGQIFKNSQHKTLAPQKPASQVPRVVPIFKPNMPRLAPKPPAPSSQRFSHGSQQWPQVQGAARTETVAPSVTKPGSVPKQDWAPRLPEPLEARPAPRFPFQPATPTSATMAHPGPSSGRNQSISDRSLAAGASVSFRQQTTETGYCQTVHEDLVGPSQPMLAKRNVNVDCVNGQPKKRIKVQENINIDELARLGQLGKANTATLISWLTKKGIPCKARDKKAELVERVLNMLCQQNST